MKIKEIIKSITPRVLEDAYHKYYKCYYLSHPKYAAAVCFRNNTGRKMNLENPQDINEKINWLKFYGDTSNWPLLADKWAVRQFVSERGLGDILVKNYGHWLDANDINF